MSHPSAKASASCASTTAPGIASTSRDAASKSSCCFAAATSKASSATSKLRKSWRPIGDTTMTDKIHDFDPAEMLQSEQAIDVFLSDAFETGHAGHIASALGAVARAKGMTEIAKRTGLAREQLYK